MSATAMTENDTAMPPATAFVPAPPVAPTAFDEAGAVATVRQAPSQRSDISVERTASERLPDIESAWRDLVARAHEPNVFMDPALIGLLGGRCATLLAWQTAASGRKLLGLWAFTIGRQWHPVSPVQVLTSPPFPQAYLATPVVDRDNAEAVLAAMLDFIAQASDLPKLIALDPIRFDGPTMRALAQVLDRRGSPASILNETQRPILVSELDAKQYFEQAMSSSSRKKLRQHRRRLEEKGGLESKVCTTPDDVSGAFEDFLQLEVSGWKGRAGTALLSSQAEADFARRMVEALAQRGDAAIHALYQQGKAVASQVVLRAGPVAFTWKTAYDESLGDYSPGMLLLENYTAAFLADKSIKLVDSCAFDDSGFMSAWSERETIAQVLFDARRGNPLGFRLVAGLHKRFLALRAVVKRLYLLGRQRWNRR
jgi:CelD/BcsL family acetyltransferase involved in cellulose biosynthesis